MKRRAEPSERRCTTCHFLIRVSMFRGAEQEWAPVSGADRGRIAERSYLEGFMRGRNELFCAYDLWSSSRGTGDVETVQRELSKRRARCRFWHPHTPGLRVPAAKEHVLDALERDREKRGHTWRVITVVAPIVVMILLALGTLWWQERKSREAGAPPPAPASQPAEPAAVSGPE